MTNVGIVLADPNFHQQLRELTRKYGTLLILDETHTICAGPGGYTRAENLDPDFLVFGKPTAGGLPIRFPRARTLRIAMSAASAELSRAMPGHLLSCAPLWKRCLRKKLLIT